MMAVISAHPALNCLTCFCRFRDSRRFRESHQIAKHRYEYTQHAMRTRTRARAKSCTTPHSEPTPPAPKNSPHVALSGFLETS